MGVSINDGGLEFKASIDLDQYKKDLVEAKKELRDWGKEAATASGQQIKSIQSLEIKLDSYRRIAEKATDPATLKRYNLEVQKLEAEIRRLTNAGKQGFDEMGNKIKASGSGLGKLTDGLKGLAAGLGIVFGVQQLYQSLKELFDLAKKSEGIELAFARVGSQQQLAALREQTRGTVDDLKLMQLAIKADNFKIPMDVLGKGLAFAQQRAKDTGEDVDYLVDSFVTGLGRKSSKVLDNLGISLIDIQTEVQKVGDYNVAVGNIIEREMKKSGEAIDTMAEKTGNAASAWANFKEKAAGFLRKLLDPSALDTSNIAKFTDSIRKAAGATDSSLKSMSRGQLDNTQFLLQSQIKGLIKERDSIIKQTYEAAKQPNNSGMLTNLNAAQKAIEEQLQASKNVLSNVNERKKALAEEERIRKNILSVTELQEKVEAKRTEAYNILPATAADKLNRQKLLDEADAIQKEIDKILGKTDKALQESADKSARLAAQSLRERMALLEKIADVEAQYGRKGMSDDEAQLQAVRDQFTKLAYEISKFNKDPKNKIKIEATILDPIRNKAIEDLTYKQNTEHLKQALSEQKQLYAEYENFRDDFGEERARARYSKEIDLSKTYLQRLEDELASVRVIPADQLTGPQQQRYKELLKLEREEQKNRQQQRDKEYKEAYDAAMTLYQRIEQITRDYQKKIDSIRANANGQNVEAQIAELTRQKEEALDIAKDEAFQKTEIYRQLNENISAYTKEQLQFQIQALEQTLAVAKGLTDQQRTAMEANLASLKNLLTTARPANDSSQVSAVLKEEEALRKQQGTLKKSLETQMLSTEEYLKQSEALAQVNEQLDAMLSKKLDAAAADFQKVSNEFSDWAQMLAPIDEGMSYTADNIAQLASAVGDVAKAGAAFASGDIYTGIKSTISAISKVFTIAKRVKEMNQQARQEVAQFYDDALKGEKEYQALLRQRELDGIRRHKLTMEGIAAEEAALKKQQQAVNNDYQTLFNELMQQQYIVDSKYEHGTWFKKAKTTYTMDSLSGKSYDEMEKLYLEGRLKDKAKEDFESLQALKGELESIGLTLEDLQQEYRKIWTGTTADNITDTVVQMFENGIPSAQKLADSFEEMMKKAALNAFQYNILEKEMESFYKSFSDAAASDGQLTQEEIEALRQDYLKKIEEATKGFQDISKVTGLNFSEKNTAASQTGLAGAIRGITAEQADLLAGQFGGQRLATLELVQVAKQNSALNQQMLLNGLENVKLLNSINVNTGRTVEAVIAQTSVIDSRLGAIQNKMDGDSAALRASGH